MTNLPGSFLSCSSLRIPCNLFPSSKKGQKSHFFWGSSMKDGTDASRGAWLSNPRAK